MCVWTLLVEGRALEEVREGVILDSLRKREQERKQIKKKTESFKLSSNCLFTSMDTYFQFVTFNRFYSLRFYVAIIQKSLAVIAAARR